MRCPPVHSPRCFQVRRELNAVKEGNAHFGELYIFEKHLCFDLKARSPLFSDTALSPAVRNPPHPPAAAPRALQVFAFHKQWVLDITETVAFLKSQVSAPCSSVRHAPVCLVHPRSAGCRDAARRRGAG